MTTNQTNNTNTEKELNDLLDEVKNLNQEIETTGEKNSERLDAVESEIDKSILKVEGIYSEINQLENEMNNDMDRLILEQVEDLAKEQ